MTSIRRFGSVAATVEELIAPHMMALAVEKLYADGYELRLDARGYLDNAVKALVLRHTGQEMVVAKKADDYATKIMRHVDFDDAETALLAISYMIAKLVQEELYPDKTNQAVLTALMVIGDKDDDSPEFQRVDKIAREKAGKMLDECLRLGLYSQTVVVN